MKLPRDLSSRDFIRLLARLGYGIDYRTAAHIRLTSQLSDRHSITLPTQDYWDVGTRSQVLHSIAEHFGLSHTALLDLLLKE